MNPTSRATVDRIDLIGTAERSRETLRRRMRSEDLEIVEWESFTTLLDDLERHRDRRRHLVLCPEGLEEIPAGWLRRVRARGVGTRVAIVAADGDEARARELQLEGATLVHVGEPPAAPVASWFDLEGFLRALYPGELPGQREEAHRLRLPSQRRWIPPTIRHLCSRFDALGYSDELVRSTLPLVIDEVLSNAMSHGNGWCVDREVDVRAWIGPQGFRLEVQDQGEGFERADVRDPIEDENLSREGGRGLFLMERLLDQVRYEDGGRRVVLVQGDPPPSWPRTSDAAEFTVGD